MPALPIVHRHLAIQMDRFTAVVEEMPDAALNWRPGGEETNSVAQIVRHVLTYQEFFLTTALGECRITDAAAFQRMHAESLASDTATRADVLAMIADARARMDEQCARLGQVDEEGSVTAFNGRAVTRLSILARAPIHAAEHLGHAELTRQFWERESGQ